MIALTHFGNGKRIAVNVDLIEKIEETPDTVITLTNGARYLVQESLDEIIDRSIEVRARIMHLAHNLPAPSEGQRLRLLRGGDPDSLQVDGPADSSPAEGDVEPREGR